MQEAQPSINTLDCILEGVLISLHKQSGSGNQDGMFMANMARFNPNKGNGTLVLKKMALGI